MIDYQPSHGMRHCMCSNVSDGFTYDPIQEAWVHGQAGCRKPRPTVQTNLHQLPAPVMAAVAKLPDVAEVQAAIEATQAPMISTPLDVGEQPAEPEPMPTIADDRDRLLATLGDDGHFRPELAEQPKRRRGRPPKDTKGYALERRDAPDRWCVIREATGEILTSGLTSKAKATAAMDDLIRKAAEEKGTANDDSPTQPGGAPDLATAGVLPGPAQPDPAQPAPTGGTSADHVPAGAGQPTGPAAGGVRATVAGGHPENQAARGAENVDQGGAESAVPGTGGHGDQPEPEAAPEALPAGPGEGAPRADPEDLPGGVGPVHEGQNDLDSRQAVTLECGEQPFTHGPQGDCPNCFRLWDWCPASFDPLPAPSNPGPAETSPTTSGPGGLPASAVQPGPPTPEQAKPSAELIGRMPAQAPRPAAPASGPSVPMPHTPGLLAALPEPSTAGDGAVDNPGRPYHQLTEQEGGPPNERLNEPVSLPGTVIDSSRPSLAAFMSAAKAVPMSGNTAWAAAYCNELREVVRWHGDNAPRNLQRHLGPSEIGHPCDRQVVGKLVGFPKTNHVVDPWPSIVGTAIHTWMDGTFQAENQRIGFERWLPERKVTPHPEHPGTSDLYDAQTFTVVDHKNLGESSMAKLRSPNGPPIHYQFQLKLYARGYRNLGLRVDRIVIIGWPRTGSSLDGAYAWEHVLTPADDQQLEQLFARMEWRNQWAAAINQGLAQLGDVPAVPDPDDCYMCPFYRPQSARDGGPGCPGHAGA